MSKRSFSVGTVLDISGVSETTNQSYALATEDHYQIRTIQVKVIGTGFSSDTVKWQVSNDGLQWTTIASDNLNATVTHAFWTYEPYWKYHQIKVTVSGTLTDVLAVAGQINY